MMIKIMEIMFQLFILNNIPVLLNLISVLYLII